MSAQLSILVVGATGKQGGQAVSTLLEEKASNLSIKFLTRNPTSEKAKQLTAKGLEAVEGSLDDKNTLKSALVGVQRAFLVTDAGAGEEKETQQGINFIEAAKVAEVEHLVFTSVGSADDAKNVPHFRSKAKVEKALKASGLSYTILRPVAFMDNFPPTAGFARFMVVGMFYASLRWKKCQLIATEDIGVFAGKALLNPESDKFKNKVIELSGGNYDLEDVRQAIFKTQGYQPWLASYTPTPIRAILPYDFRQMMYYLEDTGYSNIDTVALRSIHPGLMSLEDWFRKNGS
ncbi:hypothetical protein I203_103671 [Kwoniella mangroviensis CBS 8507]|uniref:uncharacterized protein n=1 Tax=Kwoniella mangroviensis CBS 8507 TaxID=1296122 RepID=UPI00080CDA23|nr:uncharacterized protein I203_04235 [Kwoniella mangroviensis CBS 8507]OCF66659.1 hypothetical protein I203_04235 [Kwoniella mangroviensis CBS 8507]